MSLKFSNPPIIKGPNKDLVVDPRKNDWISTNKLNIERIYFNVESTHSEDKDYSEINIISFKRSFSKLQKNYSMGNRK